MSFNFFPLFYKMFLGFADLAENDEKNLAFGCSGSFRLYIVQKKDKKKNSTPLNN